jgi:flagellar FliL protein
MGDEVVVSPQQNKGKSKIFLLILSSIMLIMVAYILYQQVIGPFMSKRAEAKKNSPQPVEIYHFQRLTTNPSGSGGKRFVVVSLAAELITSKELLEELENKNSQLQHVLIEILSSKTVEDLESKKEELRKEILDKVNEKLVTGKLKEIYFTEFIIQ